MSLEIWPAPFAGINHMMRFADMAEMKAAIHWLMGEGRTCYRHTHNIAVNVSGLEVHTSDLGTRCLAEFSKDYRK